jgi:hypothetical protein
VNDATLRLVALVAYGTQFLQDKGELEDWYRHGIFFQTRFLFREQADKTLLADELPVWLGILKKLGACRLSLHSTADADAAGFAIAVHFADRYQMWTCRSEQPAWNAHPALSYEEQYAVSILPEAAHYVGQIDTFWFESETAGSLTVPITNWSALAGEIGKDLQKQFPSAEAKGPYFAFHHHDDDWAKLPLFPYSPAMSLPHRLLASLEREKEQIDNDRHHHNDNSYYRSLSEQGAAEVDAWALRLDGWIVEVLLRCANEDRSKDSGADHGPLLRLHQPQLPQPMPVVTTATTSTQATPSASVAPGKPANLAIVLVAFAATCLFTVACANIIAAFPWLCVLIALPFALHLHYKNR